MKRANVEISSKCECIRRNFTLLDLVHALTLWEGFKTQENHSHNHVCNFHFHHNHIHHRTICTSMTTKIKPHIPMYAVEPLMKIAISMSFLFSCGILQYD